MSTISTEQAKDLRNAFECWQEDYDPVEDKEQYEMFGLGVVAMDELLALRKERERAEPVAYRYRFHPTREAAGKWILVDTLEEAHPLPKYEIQPLYTAPAATLVDDSLPYDPQIAEYEQMMEAEQAQADTTSQQFESLACRAVGEDASSMADAHMAWLNTNFPRKAYSDEEWEEVSLYTWLAWRDSQRNACFPGT
ncbi:hypothetical protein ACT5AG_002638 [Cronobacter sakazakii]